MEGRNSKLQLMDCDRASLHQQDQVAEKSNPQRGMKSVPRDKARKELTLHS